MLVLPGRIEEEEEEEGRGRGIGTTGVVAHFLWGAFGCVCVL
jgi:hypothetical protein